MPFMTFRYRCKILAVAATAVALAISLGSAEAQPCGPENEYISIAGSTTVKPLSDAWAQAYVERCPTVEIDVEGGGSKEGAARLCAVPVESTPVDIGDMSRNWLVPEEVLADESGWKFQCQLPGDESRTVLQLQVAIDAVSITMQKGGDAAKCVEAMGGLTTDQLRWMYSSFNETQLSDNGWNGTAALPNSDGNASTHLWSELSVESACLPNEIEIAGPGTGAYMHMCVTTNCTSLLLL
jgi:ABC-type phosphate transport system substrate-binding protein